MFCDFLQPKLWNLVPKFGLEKVTEQNLFFLCSDCWQYTYMNYQQGSFASTYINGYLWIEPSKELTPDLSVTAWPMITGATFGIPLVIIRQFNEVTDTKFNWSFETTMILISNTLLTNDFITNTSCALCTSTGFCESFELLNVFPDDVYGLEVSYPFLYALYLDLSERLRHAES